MGIEVEFKLALRERQTELIPSDPLILTLADGAWQKTCMKSIYYDTPDRRFSELHWTIRRRLEGTRSVICVKTPMSDSHARNEWEAEAPELSRTTVRYLTECGAPSALLDAPELIPICGAEFLRRHVVLSFLDGSRAELAVDTGFLRGETEKQPFSELELELLEGAPTETAQLAQTLCERYGLVKEPRSKFARANMLK